MRKSVFGAILLLLAVTCEFAFTDPIPRCYATFKERGDSSGDVCIGGKCVFRTEIDVTGAALSDCVGTSAY